MWPVPSLPPSPRRFKRSGRARARRAPRGLLNRSAVLYSSTPAGSMSRRMTVLMPFHTPFYAPLSAGVALGHFSEEGLDVSVLPADAFGKGTIRALLDGDIEISRGGLMRRFDLAHRTRRLIDRFTGR